MKCLRSCKHIKRDSRLSELPFYLDRSQNDLSEAIIFYCVQQALICCTAYRTAFGLLLSTSVKKTSGRQPSWKYALRIFMYGHFVTIKLPIPAVLQSVLPVVQQVPSFCSNCIFILWFKSKYRKERNGKVFTSYKTVKWLGRVKIVPLAFVH